MGTLALWLGLACALWVAGCNRSGYGDTVGLSITRVEASLPRVYPGDRQIPVTITLQNQGTEAAQVVDVRLLFRRGSTDVGRDFRVFLDAASPGTVAKQSSADLALRVDVSPLAAPGQVTIDGSVEVRLPNGSQVAVFGALDPGAWEVIGSGIAEIARVTAEAQQVQPGQANLPVRLTLSNLGNSGFDVAEVGLRFSREDADVDIDYRVVADSANPESVVSRNEAELLLNVDVSVGAATGLVSIDGWVRVRLMDGTELRFVGARQTDSWEVVGSSPDLIVTTADDEDDTGGFPSLEAAGGAADLSLREALIIANGAGKPQIIRFDPGVFPPDQPATITIAETLGSLTAVTSPGTRIDGSGSGVVLDGNGLPITGLRADAPDLTIQGITITGFHTGVLGYFVDRVKLADCTLSGNGHETTQIHIRGGSGHSLVGCTIRDSLQNGEGLVLSDEPRDVEIRANRFLNNYLENVWLSGLRIRLEDNEIRGSFYSGVACTGCMDVVMRNNQICGNGTSIYADHGLALEAQNVNVLVEGNLFSGNFGSGVFLEDDQSRQIHVTRCSFEGSGQTPISMAIDANQGILPPAITSFDGSVASGTAAADGEVEVYQVAPGAIYTYLGSAPVSGGSWSLTLAAPVDAVAATVTTVEGSTSAFSEPVPRS